MLFDPGPRAAWYLPGRREEGPEQRSMARTPAPEGPGLGSAEPSVKKIVQLEGRLSILFSMKAVASAACSLVLFFELPKRVVMALELPRDQEWIALSTIRLSSLGVTIGKFTALQRALQIWALKAMIPLILSLDRKEPVSKIDR